MPKPDRAKFLTAAHTCFRAMCLLSVLSHANAASPKENSPDVGQALSLSKQLAEMLRQDVESVHINPADVVRVQLVNHLPNRLINGSGLIIPFLMSSRGGGNVTWEYVALFQVLEREDWRLRSFGFAQNPHKDVALLAFTQLDLRRWRVVDWSMRSINGDILKVGACEEQADYPECPGPSRGSIFLRFNGDTFGPNLTVSQTAVGDTK